MMSVTSIIYTHSPNVSFSVQSALQWWPCTRTWPDLVQPNCVGQPAVCLVSFDRPSRTILRVRVLCGFCFSFPLCVVLPSGRLFTWAVLTIVIQKQSTRLQFKTLGNGFANDFARTQFFFLHRQRD